MVAFEKGGEGLEFMPGSDLSKWEKSFVADQALGYYGIQGDWDNPEHTLISVAPYCIAYRRNPIHIEGSYKLRYYIGLPFIKDRSTVGSPYMQCSANSRWLSDAQLETIAKSGIKLIRFHNDYAEKAPFWRDGRVSSVRCGRDGGAEAGDQHHPSAGDEDHPVYLRQGVASRGAGLCSEPRGVE